MSKKGLQPHFRGWRRCAAPATSSVSMSCSMGPGRVAS